MSKNVNSSDGIAEDLIRCFVQFGCAELHAKTLFEKANASLESGLIDVDDGLHLLEIYESQIEKYADLRRSVMLKLKEMYPNGNHDTWCLVKHLGIAMYTMFESYQASDRDARLLELWNESNKAFTEALSMFLGTEITDCAACFADMIKEVNYEQS